MCARFSDPPRRCAAGFTMVELLVVIVLLGVLVVVALPKLNVALGVRSDAARDEVLAALRYAGQTAQSHRRLVCAEVSGSSVSLRIATARPATTCNAELAGPDGSSQFTTGTADVALALAPGGTLYFQPDGRVTTDGAGANATTRTLTVSGAPSITVGGETGLAR